MKTRMILFALGTAIWMLNAVAQEAGEPRQGPPPGERGEKPPQPPLEAAIDTNRDGTIDADEMANASTALKSLDKNGDGKLTVDEYRPAMPRGRMNR